ncbi:MAG TPA: hypothetical protein VJL61_00785 [Rhodanobacteraceae bacterium]|nr:hypothetical protein [Rhodanobacteraceae bacterium]
MIFLSVAVSIVFLVYLLLRISRMLGGGTRVVQVGPDVAPPELPHRSDTEINALLASMPTAWVTYEGMTPPLQLKVRGLSHELYRRFTKAKLDAYGRDLLNSLPPSEAIAIAKSLLPDVNAAAYVVDWKGAMYPNGKAVPYSPDNMATLMRKDEMLRNFISDEAGKLGPAW